MFDTTRAKWIAGSIGVACVAAVPFLPPKLAALAAALGVVSAALVNFWSGPTKGSGSAVGVATLTLCQLVCLMIIIGCGGANGTKPPTFLDAVNALEQQHVDEGHRTAVAVCVLAQTYRAEIPQTQALELCTQEAYVKAYSDEALYLRSVVLAHRNKLDVPERCPAFAAPASTA